MPSLPATDYSPRVCSICDADTFEVLNRNTQERITRKGVFIFHAVEGICRNCGFVYTNPVPRENYLYDYYRSKYLHSVGQPEYDMDKRIAYLQKVRGSRRTLLEVGSGEGSFLHAASKIGFDVAGLELNESAGSLPFSSEVHDMNGECEVVVANYVLEHISSPLLFLQRLRSYVKNGGILILEVPNLHLYGMYYTSVMYEHLSHFSPANLAFLMTKAGFEVLEYEFRQVSRLFGFGILARRSDTILARPVPQEYEVNRSYYLAAISAMHAKEDRYRAFMQNICTVSRGAKIAMWGANTVMLDLLKTIPSSYLGRIVAVDANKDRWNTQVHDQYPITIFDPDCLRDGNINTVIVCAVDWEKEITQSLFRMGYRKEQIKIAPMWERKREEEKDGFVKELPMFSYKEKSAGWRQAATSLVRFFLLSKRA